MAKLIKIENDVFFIANRLKEIDDSYEIYYNTHLNCYEVHSNKQIKNTYCFKVPFDFLDERTIHYARKTRYENMAQLLAEIERQNEFLYEKNVKQQACLLKELLCM